MLFFNLCRTFGIKSWFCSDLKPIHSKLWYEESFQLWLFCLAFHYLPRMWRVFLFLLPMLPMLPMHEQYRLYGLNYKADIEDAVKSWFFFEALKLGYLIHLHPLDNAHAEHTTQKSPVNLSTYRTLLRRERDSNPRYLAVRRFSRPVHSTTLPSLHANYGRLFVFASAKIHNVWQYAKYLLYFFRRLLTVASWCANVQTYRCKELTS